MNSVKVDNMAYVVWRVFMKKYSRVRLGLHTVPGVPTVTPTSRHTLTYDEETWKPKSEDHCSDTVPLKSKEGSPDEVMSSEVRTSTTKRVKKYLKRCKNALGKSNSSDQLQGETVAGLEDILNESKVEELKDIYENVQKLDSTSDFRDMRRVANIVNVQMNSETVQDENEEECAKNVRGELEDAVSIGPIEFRYLLSPLLTHEQEQDDDNYEKSKLKSDVTSLVDRYFGDFYVNYQNSRKCLVRQARDVLICEYHGSLSRFEDEFCIPAAKLLHHLKSCCVLPGSVPSGWPLCLGSSGVIVHLGSLSPTLVRHRDCYLCIRSRSAPGLEIALVWRNNSKIRCQTVAEFTHPSQNYDEIMCSTLMTAMDLEPFLDAVAVEEAECSELPQLLQNLLVSVEHAIERVPLDDLANPCPQCHEYVPLEKTDPDVATCACQCECSATSDIPIEKKDTSMQTSPMFEFASSIPHIDSDEDEDKDTIKSGLSAKKPQELVATPRRITDISEKSLMSGINLPGTVDIDGRCIILCYAECIVRANLNKYEIAQVLLYYTSIPSSRDTKKGFTLLLLAEADQQSAITALDKAVTLSTLHKKIERFLIWTPGGTFQNRTLPISAIKVITVCDEASLEAYVVKDQAPASCGGSCNHDQLEWVEFFKQLEPFLASCRTAGCALLSALSQLRKGEVPSQVTRRFLNHQCRQIAKALQIESVQKLRRDGQATINSLEERRQWLYSSRDVHRNVQIAEASFNSVDRVAKRLEQLATERKNRLKELARLRSLQDEAEELLAWIRQVGDESIRSHILLLRAAVDVENVKCVEKDFEKFYFNAMRQIDKSGDLIDESNNIPDMPGKSLKHFVNNLKVQMKAFTERLEETRENIEDCSRCFELLEHCQANVEDNSKELEDFKQLVSKTPNDKLEEIYKVMQSPRDHSPLLQHPNLDEDSPNHEDLGQQLDCIPVTSTPLKGAQIRRRSVSSVAFIYKCNHHAAGFSCNCYESDAENSVSYRLKKKYMQLQTCGCNTSSHKDTLDRKNSLTLDGIKELRESVEHLDIVDKNDSGLSGCGRCDSGVSTADNSVGDDSGYKKKFARMCSCQYYRESCPACSAPSSSTESNQDHTENQRDNITEEGSDGCGKSTSDDIEDDHFSDERRQVLPVPANSHLHCHSSNLHLSSDYFDSKTQKTLLYIMREMIQTERDYVKSLDYVIENYLPELMREDIPQALRGQRNVIFGNIEKIYEFHNHYFLRELDQCECNPLQVGQIFLKYNRKFALYALYNKNKPKSDSLMSEYGSTFFKSKQCELGDKMDLASYLLKPVQRMGKYALLLQQMMKACPAAPPGASERIIAEQDELKQAEQMVRFQLRHGNDLLAMDSIRDCDVNLKEQGDLIRQNEFLVWEGRSGKKSLRQVFLFEELILFSKARRFPDRKNLDLYIYKNSIKMTDIGLTAKIGDSPTKFEIWFRKRKPNDTFTLQSMSEDVKKAWAEELSQLLWKQAIKNRATRMIEMSSMGIGNKPCLDIRPSADQINDRSISFAQLSKTAPRFRNSIVGPANDLCRSTKRPHSVISMSSISSSSTSSGGSTGCGLPTPTTPLHRLGFDSACDSPKACRRSATLHSQCSTESGIIADISIGVEECQESVQGMHWPLEKSNSQYSSSSNKSNSTIPTQSDDTQVTIYHVPDDLPINI